MEPLQFAYWLQGFSELNGAPPTPEQWQSIREHLATVFTKVTPRVVGPAVAGGYPPAAPAMSPMPVSPFTPGAIC